MDLNMKTGAVSGLICNKCTRENSKLDGFEDDDDCPNPKDKEAERIKPHSDVPVELHPIQRLTSSPESFMVGLYEHYRGGLYTATGLSRHHDTRELFVEYVSLTTGAKCTREYASAGKDSWTDLVSWPTGDLCPRFWYLNGRQPT